MAALAFNFILLLLLFTANLQLTHQAVGSTVSVSVQKGESLNVVGRYKTMGRKLMEEKKQKLVVDNGEISEKKSNYYHKKEMKDDTAAGFVAYNADYRFPRHHPPKNN